MSDTQDTVALELRDPLRTFAQRMEAKLRDNDHKRHWGGFSCSWLLYRLRQETGELERALDDGSTAEDIIDEAADVANFAMMIADNARRGR